MPSPFPGMDPFIESQKWEAFHFQLIMEIARTLVPQVRPRYEVVPERRAYMERDKYRKVFLLVRDRKSLEPVTVIEALSPGDKILGSDARRRYVAERAEVIEHGTNLVELDLLRGGELLPAAGALPTADYFAFACRKQDCPRSYVWAWTLRDCLPTLPVPLAADRPDLLLDLQAVFTRIYDDYGYDYSLDYRAPIEPPLGAADAAWVANIVKD